MSFPILMKITGLTVLEFDLEVSQNTEDCVTVEVGTNQDGIGIEKIVKTPYGNYHVSGGSPAR